MRTAFLAMLCCAAFALAACATPPAQPSHAPVRFVVVRHAEKAADAGEDPPLTDAGRARAERLAALLRDRDLVAVYATGFRRTRDTAAPVAAAHGLAVAPYDATTPAPAFAAALRASHASGTVLVVGHSNTVPGIVAALCACTVAPIDESDYGNLYEVDLAPGAPPVLAQRRF